MTATDFLAIYGSLLATGLAAWDVAKYVLERPRLRLQCYIARIVGAVISDQNRLLAYSIANTGGKPIVVTTVGGADADGTFFMLVQNVDQLPRTLQPGESMLITGPLPADIHRIGHFHVIDALNRPWRTSTDTVAKQLAERPLVPPAG